MYVCGCCRAPRTRERARFRGSALIIDAAPVWRTRPELVAKGERVGVGSPVDDGRSGSRGCALRV